MVQHWTPMSQLQRDVEPGVWLMMDKSKRIAMLRHVEVWVGAQKHRLLRAVTYAERSEDRVLLGYFPEDALPLAAALVWGEWVKVNPSVSNRR